MILNSLIIDKIRSYDHQEIEFPLGISLFEGDIGSGKSTVLMAIEFALFGLGSQKAESLLAKKAEDGYVILEFSVDGEKYEIKRTLKRKSSGVNQDPKNSWIKIAGQKEPLSPTELKQRVLQILKFNEPDDPKSESKIYRYAIFTPQEMMKEVLSDSKKRLETIRRAFGIEDYNQAAKNAKEVAGEVKSQMNIFQERSSNIAELESQIQNSASMVVQFDSDLKKFETESKKLESEKAKENEELKGLIEKNKEKTRLETRKENLEEKIDEGKSRIIEIKKEIAESENSLEKYAAKLSELAKITRPTTKSLKEIEQEMKILQGINNELIKTQSESQNISERLHKLKNRLGDKVNLQDKDLEKQIAESKEKLNELDSEGIKEKLDSLNILKIENETIKRSLEEEVARFTKLGAQCPTCDQKITPDHHHKLEEIRSKKIAEIDSKLKDITDSFFDLKDKDKKIESQREEIKTKISLLEQALPDIAEYQECLTHSVTLEKKTRDLQKQFTAPSEYKENPLEFLGSLKDALVKFENSQQQIEQATLNKTQTGKLIQKYQLDLDSLENTDQRFRQELVDLESQIKSFEDLDEKIRLKEDQIEEISTKINKASSQFTAIRENKRNEEERISENKLKIAESKRWKKQYELFSQCFDWLVEYFIPTLNQIEKQVLVSILQNFNDIYKRWYSMLVEDSTKESRIDENFTPIVNQDGYEQEIGFLSGGEKTSIALAYRLTLNSLMRKESESMKSNLLILDEPTDGFSKNQLSKIRELLDELKSEQIILVSHEKELETHVDNIFNISKQDGVSKVSRL